MVITKSNFQKELDAALAVLREEDKAAKLKALHSVSKILKNDSQLKKGLLFGIVYEPNSEDSHGDYTSADEIEKAAHDFLPRAMINLDHEDNEPDVQVIESYIARSDFRFDGSDEMVKKGSWVLGTRIISSSLRRSIENGDYTGYSLEGQAQFRRAA